MNRQANRNVAGSLLGIIMALISAGIANESGPPSKASPSDDQPRLGVPGTTEVMAGADELLGKLNIEEEPPRQGYSRDEFPHWATQEDGCTTRQRVLIDEREEGDVDECVVVDGRWFSFYDAAVETVPRRLDIDHMVPLAEAWDSGASAWTLEERAEYANDLGYDDALVAVTAGSNRSKSDQDPAEWQPPDEEVWCRYATAWTTMKIRWSLSADESEVEALREMFMRCLAVPETSVEVAR